MRIIEDRNMNIDPRVAANHLRRWVGRPRLFDGLMSQLSRSAGKDRTAALDLNLLRFAAGLDRGRAEGNVFRINASRATRPDTNTSASEGAFNGMAKKDT